MPEWEILDRQDLNASERRKVLEFIRRHRAPIADPHAESFFSGEHSVVHVARSGNELVGLAFTRLDHRTGRGHTHTGVVHGQWRRRNVGRVLFVRSFDWLAERGAAEAEVPVMHSPIIRELEGLGFTPERVVDREKIFSISLTPENLDKIRGIAKRR